LFVETSVVVAILLNEPDSMEFVNRIEGAVCVTSALVILEAAMPAFDEDGIEIVPMDAASASLAVKAFAD